MLPAHVSAVKLASCETGFTPSWYMSIMKFDSTTSKSVAIVVSAILSPISHTTDRPQLSTTNHTLKIISN